MRHVGAAPAERARGSGRAESWVGTGVDPAEDDAAVEHPVALSLGATGPVVLAVSGGMDSMALLHATVRAMPASLAAVATFDHGTGGHAGAAVELVAARCAAYGVTCDQGRAPAGTPGTEAAWRAARWHFLRERAAHHDARVVTAHTRDDHLETLIIRILRHAGARGLAGLDADGAVVRPWLTVRRAAVTRYAARHGVRYVEDPSNQSRAFLRNRVRLDLLPALLRVRPMLDAELLAVADAAARWRRDIEHLVAAIHPVRLDPDGLSIAAADLVHYDGAALAIVWPVLAARVGLALDRRGTTRLAAFTKRGKVGGAMQLSGGYEVRRSTFSFVLRRGDGAGRVGSGRTSRGR
jgi:tRNA(Ile)-lysidine synthase